ncbi:hypothetical protein BD408DRAFT_413328 [Parasitella parasitica]|nr:hypothetical protein BD408DRAFT_413328 [Parasitella parasitica]
MRGKRSGPTKTIIKALQKCKENRGVTVQMVDEYLTSQVCNNCKKKEMLKTLCNDQQSEEYILYYSVKKPLVLFWNRDMMAAKQHPQHNFTCSKKQ